MDKYEESYEISIILGVEKHSNWKYFTFFSKRGLTES